jgi:hypothetical protein
LARAALVASIARRGSLVRSLALACTVVALALACTVVALALACTVVALALATAASAAGAAAPAPAHRCTESDYFEFEVERVRGTADGADGIEVRVQAGGAGGIRRSVGIVNGGRLRVCIVGAAPGEFVDVRVSGGKRAFRLLYPPRGRVPVSRWEPPTIVVCEVEKDCGLLTTEEAARLVRRAIPSVASLRAEDKEAWFKLWREFLNGQGLVGGELVEAILKKERQVAAASAASELLSRFSNRANEVVDRFRRYGPDAIAHPSVGPVTQINAAIAAYHPIYDELKEKTDSYRKATAESWGEERSAEFQSLVDEALRIHQRIYALNALGTLITDCRHGWEKTCPDKAAAIVRVRVAAEHTAGEVESELTAFAWRRDRFLEALDEELLEAAPPPGDLVGGASKH